MVLNSSEWCFKESRTDHRKKGGKPPPRPQKVLPMPSEVDRVLITGRGQWKEVGKNQNIRRMFISGGVSMFAETMRYWLEEAIGEVLPSFSEVVSKSIHYWDMLSDSDKDGWAFRARVEKKVDHYIYMRKIQAREKALSQPDLVCLELSDCESDPDELPGQMVVNIPMTYANTVRTFLEPIREEESPPPRKPALTNMTYTNRNDVLYQWTASNDVRYAERESPMAYMLKDKKRKHHNSRVHVAGYGIAE